MTTARPAWTLAAAFAAVLLGGGLLAAPGASGQGFLDRYRTTAAARQAEARGAGPGDARAVLPVEPLAVLDSAANAALAWFASGDLPLVVEPLPHAFAATSVRVVRRLERLGFRNRYAQTPWAYAGPLYRTTLDTMRTWRLRAALEARYGAPSETVGDLGADTRLGLGSAFEFEYWFVVNDSIPLRVSDAGGPLDRGLIVSTDAKYRDRIYRLREAVFGDLATTRPAPFADYYFDPEAKAWWVVGYDGFRFVRRAIPRPDFRTVGRPPVAALRAGG